MSAYEKSVKGATKVKLAPPKSKYIEHILRATHNGESGVAEVFRTLQLRIRDSTWTIAFKALTVVHLMIRDGEPNVTLKYLAQSPSKMLSVNHYTDIQTQGRNIRCYARYLVERARAFAKTKCDFVGSSTGRLKKLTVDKGLLRETESIQDQIAALIQCDMFKDEPENEISLTAFRTVTMDLLVLFQAMNEGTINVLEHYFEMSKPDAERAVGIYRTFAKQTDQVVRFLSMAREYEYVTRLEIPKIKHAPTNLGNSLEEYLNDKDFEINRRQYIAQQEAKKGGKFTSSASGAFGDSFGDSSSMPSKTAFPTAKETASASAGLQQTQTAKGPAPDLIDFFESIETRQQPMASAPVQFQQQPQFQQPPPMFGQPTGFQQQTNPFGQPQQQAQQQQQQPQFTQLPQQTGFDQFQPQVQTFPQVQQQQQPQHQPQALNAQFTGAGFGGYTAQPQQSPPPMPQISQQTGFPSTNGFQSFPQQQQQQQHQPTAQQMSPQQTNPFRQSMMPQPTGMPFAGTPSAQMAQHTGQNPFAHNQPPQQAQQQQQQQQGGLLPQRTGTNPFAKPAPAPQQQSLGAAPIMSNPTGSTNPFRQSQFVNQQTGQGWQNQQGTMGGLEQLPTHSVFPRPGQPQGHQQSPWG